MRVIVFGASGVQGVAQIEALVRAGHHPVAVSRNPKPLNVGGKDVETAATDFNDADGVARALKGGEIVFLNLPTTSFNHAEPIMEGAKLIGKLSKEAGINLLIFNTSMPVPEESKNIKAQDDRREMRRHLREAGVPVISIQPVVYLNNLLEGWALPPIRDTNTLVYCHKPTLESSWISHQDLAKLMIAAMERPHLAGRNFAVGGPETVRLPHLAEILSRGWDRKMAYECQSVDDFCVKISNTMGGRGLDQDRIIAQMHKAYTWYNEAPEEPFKIDMGPVLKELPVELTPIEQWAREHPPPPPLVST